VIFISYRKTNMQVRRILKVEVYGCSSQHLLYLIRV